MTAERIVSSGQLYEESLSRWQRKSSGTYYTPPQLVRFVVRETLAPLIAARGADAILGLKVLDPAMGCGNFLVEACHHLAEQLAGAQGLELGQARRLVAQHCLYGVDCDPVAVELARQAVGAAGGLESPELLDAQLRCGDALAGPLGEQLFELPAEATPLPAPLPQLLLEQAPERLLPLAAAFTGAVRLGSASDQDFTDLAQTVAQGADLAAFLAQRPAVAQLIEQGKDALAFGPIFPGRFDAVLGNPPWEAIRRHDSEFFASLDGADPQAPERYAAYRQTLRQQDRIAHRLYRLHRARLAGGRRLAGRGTYDAWMLFVERAHQLLAAGGGLGLVLPGAFHGSEGAAGVRRLLVDQMRLRCCYSFENRAQPRLFAIDSRFKFAVVIAEKSAPAEHFSCAFYRRDTSWLEQPHDRLCYSRQLLGRTGGDSLTFLELRSPAEQRIAEGLYGQAGPLFGEHCAQVGISLRQEVNMTYDAGAFVAATQAQPPEQFLPLHEGKTFHQYSDRWAPPRYFLRSDSPSVRDHWRAAAGHYRLAFRAIASATNERTAIFCLLPPGHLLGNSAPGERTPMRRDPRAALALLAVANSFCFDWALRGRASANVNLFILNRCPLPSLSPAETRFLSHAALRLSCNHAGYAALWQSQLGSTEASPSWPVLDTDLRRWEVRADIDALVAAAYGLSREEYSQVLGAFHHRTFAAAPQLCLDAFDQLFTVGKEAFLRERDPFWNRG